VIAVTRRPGKSLEGRDGWDALAQTLILFFCFAGAGLAGCLTVAWAGEAGASTLAGYLHGYVELLSGGTAATASLWSVIWELCRWPLLVFLLGLTAFGGVAIPAVFCVRGFLLAYSIASFMRVFGAAGILAALAIFAMTAFASVPALFCVGTLAFSNSLRLAAGALENRPAALFPRELLWSVVPCGALLALAAVLQGSLMPQLLILATQLLQKG